MEGKLYKSPNGEHYYLTVNGQIFAEIDGHPLKSINQALSLKNCEAIENGYDLDEVVEDIVKTIVPNDRGEDIWYGTSMAVGKLCFQKALEILGDKKFSEEDMKKAIHFGASWREQLFNGTTKTSELFESLQQTEWDVEIVMDICGDKVYAVPEPALDENGCLILRRI